MNDPAIEKRAEMYALSLQVIANKDRYIRELTDMLTDISHSWRLACNGKPGKDADQTFGNMDEKLGRLK